MFVEPVAVTASIKTHIAVAVCIDGTNWSVSVGKYTCEGTLLAGFEPDGVWKHQRPTNPEHNMIRTKEKLELDWPMTEFVFLDVVGYEYQLPQEVVDKINYYKGLLSSPVTVD